MTTFRGGSSRGVKPDDLLVRLSRGAYPIGLVAPGVTRRPVREPTVAVSRQPGRQPSRPAAPHREERCLARHTHLEIIRS